MYYLLAIFLLILVSQTISFIPPASTLSSSRLIFKTRKMLTPSTDSTSLSMFGEDENAPKSLTRDNEPDEFFKSKMDDMSDGEKLPIALAGLAGISLPFILGLIALYAAK